jgi:hypothetical protein
MTFESSSGTPSPTRLCGRRNPPSPAHLNCDSLHLWGDAHPRTFRSVPGSSGHGRTCPPQPHGSLAQAHFGPPRVRSGDSDSGRRANLKAAEGLTAPRRGERICCPSRVPAIGHQASGVGDTWRLARQMCCSRNSQVYPDTPSCQQERG